MNAKDNYGLSTTLIQLSPFVVELFVNLGSIAHVVGYYKGGRCEFFDMGPISTYLSIKCFHI